MYRLPCLAAIAWLWTAVPLRAQELPSPESELKGLAGGGKECATSFGQRGRMDDTDGYSVPAGPRTGASAPSSQ